MKKILLFAIIIISIVAIVGFRYVAYKNAYNSIQKENREYEQYQNKDLNGLDVATVINKAMDRNTRNNIPKD